SENLEPDFLVFGKPIDSGVPGAVYGFTQEIAEKIAERQNLEDCDVGGVGGTLAGNALSLAAMRATLSKVLTKEAFDHMIPMAERWTEGVRKAIAEFAVPWHVTRLGCRAQYLFSIKAPKNGTQAHDAMDFERKQILSAAAKARDMPGHCEFGNRFSYSLSPALRHRNHVVESFFGQYFAQGRPHRSQ